jgi:hypothetical protein
MQGDLEKSGISAFPGGAGKLTVAGERGNGVEDRDGGEAFFKGFSLNHPKQEIHP